jgi:hypothetical protein
MAWLSRHLTFKAELPDGQLAVFSTSKLAVPYRPHSQPFKVCAELVASLTLRSKPAKSSDRLIAKR